MPHEVTLVLDSSPDSPPSDSTPLKATLITESVTLDTNITRLEGLDPAHYPREMQEYITFHAHNHTALIKPDSPLSVTHVEPTDDPVPETVPNS